VLHRCIFFCKITTYCSFGWRSVVFDVAAHLCVVNGVWNAQPPQQHNHSDWLTLDIQSRVSDSPTQLVWCQWPHGVSGGLFNRVTLCAGKTRTLPNTERPKIYSSVAGSSLSPLPRSANIRHGRAEVAIWMTSSKMAATSGCVLLVAIAMAVAPTGRAFFLPEWSSDEEVGAEYDAPEVPQGAASLAFVFDITGSMYDDLVQVIDGAARILATTLARRDKPLYNYVLVPFHDPGRPPLLLNYECNAHIIMACHENFVFRLPSVLLTSRTKKLESSQHIAF